MTNAGISQEALFKEIGYTPHQAQRLLHDSTARFRIACCGRKWGKSMAIGHELTAKMFIPDKRYWIVGPTYALGEKEFRVVYDDMFRKLALGQDKRFRKSYNVDQGNMRIECPWNTILEVKSADKKDSLVGEVLNHVVMSEAALHDQDTWQMYVEPALATVRGSADFVSTPRGHNWFEGLWMMGQDPEFELYESWRFPTWANDASFPEGEHDPEIERIRKSVSEFHWRQEYCAEFTAIEGKIYDEFAREIHVPRDRIEYNPYWKNFQAFDFGFTDPFVCLDIMIDPMDNVYVWREYQVRRKTTYEHGMGLLMRNNPPQYHVDARFADPRGADEIATLKTLIGPVHGRVVPWTHGIEAVKRHLKIQNDGKPKLFIDRSCTELIRQMDNLVSIEPREGKNAREGQKDYDDHGPDALRYFFSEYFVLGYRSGGLNDVYRAEPGRTEANSFFSYHQQLVNSDFPIPYGSA